MEKINIAELLKNCPQGMELDCVSYDNVSFDKISDDKKATYPIFCYITDKEGNRSGISFTENGCESKRYGAKCVIFPKGKTSWKGFAPPCKFKDGDIVSTMNGIWIGIVKKPVNCAYETYITINGESLMYDNPIFCFERFATEEETNKLFKAIKENGYRWDAETKTLEELPKFKMGDRIKQVGSPRCYIIQSIEFDRYILHNNQFIRFEDEHIYELVPNKFDINTLVPFESKVLVRDNKLQKWNPAIWGFYDSDCQNYHYKLIGGIARYCIPYEGNEYLLGKTDDCDEYYKT